MSLEDLRGFLAQVRGDQALQARLRRCSAPEAAAMAQELGYSVRCGDLLRYESRAFAWQLSDAEYDVLARLQRPRRHWWQACWPDVRQNG
jgi:predicted ribosomally synthesized peptide with nif11-like leader